MDLDVVGKSEKTSGPALWVIATKPSRRTLWVESDKPSIAGSDSICPTYSPRIDITSALRCLHEVRFCAVRDSAHGFLVGGISEIKGEGVVSAVMSGDEYLFEMNIVMKIEIMVKRCGREQGAGEHDRCGEAGVAEQRNDEGCGILGPVRSKMMRREKGHHTSSHQPPTRHPAPAHHLVPVRSLPPAHYHCAQLLLLFPLDCACAGGACGGVRR